MKRPVPSPAWGIGYVSRMPIPYGRQSVDESDVEAAVAVMRSAMLTQGPKVDEFERALADACGAPYAVAFSSGTAALHGAAFAAGLEPGDELVTSAITFAASANCAAYVGATPRFADVHLATGNVTADSVTAALTDRTRAVVPVDFAGLPAPVAEIREAVGDSLCIIEDAAHALGALDDGQPIGSCESADMAVFSFHPLKAITTAEGGAVTTREGKLRDRLRSFRNHGFALDAASRQTAEGGWWYEQDALGYNYRLSDVHSALGISQLAKLEQFIERRNRIADRYDQALGSLEGIRVPARPAAADARHAFHLYVIQVEGGADSRRELYDFLRSRGILVQVHYIPVYRHPYYRRAYGYAAGACEHAERFYSRCLSLPCYPSLTSDEQDEVIAALGEWVAR